MDPTDTNKTKLDVYQESFEKTFLKVTQDYYRAESEKYIADNGIVEYLKKVRTFTNPTFLPLLFGSYLPPLAIGREEVG